MILSTNVLFGVQSIHIKSGELTGMYYDYALAAPYMSGIKEKAAAGEDSEILILGMGTGTYATQLLKSFDNVNVEGVEIDDKITNLAHEYFELPDEAKVTTYDGRAYLAAVDKKYDVIMVDAYQDITIPFQMSSTEFFNMVKEHLAPGGVMVVNMNMYSDENEATINRYLADTISSVFDNVVTVKVPNSTNKELFATDNAEFMNRFSENIRLENDTKLRTMMDIVGLNVMPYNAGDKIMTDDKAPVELLGMKQIDSIIKDEVGYYKEIYRTQGLEGLF